MTTLSCGKFLNYSGTSPIDRLLALQRALSLRVGN